jgi:SDR family mycofactocin-dependent oxidoreductase
MRPMGRVEGKVAFITGGARGQGRSHAVRLAEEGADVVIVDACEDVPTSGYAMATTADLEETAGMVEALGRRVLARRADVRDQAALDAVVAEALAALGPIEIVSANAGVANFGRSWELTDEQWNDVLDIDLTGVWRTTKAVVPSMLEAGRGGSIVLTSSAGGVQGIQNFAHYVAAKHGVVGLMKTLANEVAEHRIRVNAVVPGTVLTPMAMNEPAYKLFRPDLEAPTLDDVKDAMQSMHALPVPWLDPIDVSNAILWLSSDEARYVTGVVLPIDAGWINKSF